MASIQTWTPDPLQTTIFNADRGSINDSKPNRPTIYVPPPRVRPRSDGRYTDKEMGRLTLEAWRVRLRNKHDYLCRGSAPHKSQNPAGSVVEHEDKRQRAEGKRAGGVSARPLQTLEGMLFRTRRHLPHGRVVQADARW